MRGRSVGAVSPASTPPVVHRRDFLIGSALAGTALIAALASARLQQPAREIADLETLVPDRIGRWVRYDQAAIVIPAGESLTEQAYDEVLTRLYTSASAAPIMLLIAYGGAQSGATQLHRPEACYPAAGFALSDWPDLTLELAGKVVPASLVTASSNERTEQILYWSRVGEEFPTSAPSQRWSVMRHYLRGSIPDGVLVRISALNEDLESSVRLLREFAAALIDKGSSRTRSLLVGAA
jgi:EpsI family protein